MNDTMIQLGKPATDKATGLSGACTHMNIHANGARWYRFQPRGLNSETGEPVKSFWLADDRLSGTEVPLPDLPMQVIGTEVEDEASGFKGMATGLCLHINGCVHISVQPRGTQPKTGDAIEAGDFDIRRLKGAAIPVMTDEEKQADQRSKPSPVPVPPVMPS